MCVGIDLHLPTLFAALLQHYTSSSLAPESRNYLSR